MHEDVSAKILVIERPGAALSSDSDSLPRASFISQLIAERYRLAPQRQSGRAALDTALDCYDAAEQSTVRRMPAGYRTSLEA